MNSRENNTEKLSITAVPRTAEQYLAKRKLKSKRTLNDEVETVHLALADDEQYQAYLDPVYDSEAVEGSLSIDDAKASEMIREKAREMAIVAIQNKNLATLVKALRVVLRRTGDSRDERRNKLHGEVVPPPSSSFAGE
jgi:hypothetical protein